MTDEAMRPMADGMEEWVIVPLRATHAMEEAGHSRLADDGTLADLYDAMLTGAPAHPASEAIARLVKAAKLLRDLLAVQIEQSDMVPIDVEIMFEEIDAVLAPFLPKESGE